MKKEYLKPTTRFHELRCNRIMDASQMGEQGKLQMGNSFLDQILILIRIRIRMVTISIIQLLLNDIINCIFYGCNLYKK